MNIYPGCRSQRTDKMENLIARAILTLKSSLSLTPGNYPITTRSCFPTFFLDYILCHWITVIALHISKHKQGENLGNLLLLKDMLTFPERLQKHPFCGTTSTPDSFFFPASQVCSLLFTCYELSTNPLINPYNNNGTSLIEQPARNDIVTFAVMMMATLKRQVFCWSYNLTRIFFSHSALYYIGGTHFFKLVTSISKSSSDAESSL